MSTSSNLHNRSIRIETDVPTVEIYVVSSTGDVVDRGVQSFTTKPLRPGLYKIRCRIGNRVFDELIELPPGDGDFAWHPHVAPPIATTATVAPVVTAPSPSGSSLTVAMVSPPDPGDGPTESLRVRVLDAAHHEIGRVPGSVPSTFNVPPGSYLIEIDVGDDVPVQQTMYVSAGWQTCVCVPMIPGRDRWTADPSDAAVFMSPEGMPVSLDSSAS